MAHLQPADAYFIPVSMALYSYSFVHGRVAIMVVPRWFFGWVRSVSGSGLELGQPSRHEEENFIARLLQTALTAFNLSTSLTSLRW